MNGDSAKFIMLADTVLAAIPTSKEKAITSSELKNLFGISFRELKMIITILREKYPIVSKETDGGGYWLATIDEDIYDFIAMIARRRDGYNNTISTMQKYITPKE
jgi:DNA-binding IscR family transcriptional regulator